MRAFNHFTFYVMKPLYILMLVMFCSCKKATETQVQPQQLTEPSFQWLRSISGPDDEVARGITNDGQGNLYITGSFASNVKLGNQFYFTNGLNDIFLTKLDANGNTVWSKTFGSPGADYAFDVDGDAAGNHYVTGMFKQTMQLPGGLSVSSLAEGDVFTAKFSSSGNCEWVKTGKGNGTEYGNEINLTTNGNVLIIGPTDQGVNFEGTQLLNTDNNDVFVNKYNNNGNLLWAKLLAGPGKVSGRGISSDRNDNTLITGSFSGTLNIGNKTLNSVGTNNDIFIGKLDVNGNAIWAKAFGNTGEDYARGIDADAEGNIYVSGIFTRTINFEGITLTSNTNTKDIFLVKLNPQGNIVWVKNYGGAGEEEGCEIEVADDGTVFITGGFSSTMSIGNKTVASLGQRDVFIAKINTGGDLQWIKTAGGTQDDVNYAISLNRTTAEVVTVGTFSGTFYQATQSIVSFAGYDSYISKLK